MMDDLVAALRALSDDDLRAAVRAATVDRAALSAIHDAAQENYAPALEATVVEVVPPIVAPAPDYTDTGVPTMTGVRDKVGRAIGSAELERETSHGKSLEEQWEERRAAGRERLEQIRRSMKGNE